MGSDRIGYFGKVPARADFVKLAHDAAVMGMLDSWLAQVMTLLATDARWRLHYDTMAPVSFVLVGPARRHAVAGHLLASHDHSGRRFPFMATRTLALRDPAGFVAYAPIAFAPLWTFLEQVCPQVLAASEPADLLHSIADSSIGLGDEQAMLRWREQTTLTALDAQIGSSGANRIMLALGLLLQPVLFSKATQLRKSLVLPLPQEPQARFIVAAFWLELVAPFLRRTGADLALFITRLDGQPVLVVGFCAALAETLHAVVNPLVGREFQVNLLDTAWIDAQIQRDTQVRTLACQLDQSDLPLKLATTLFMHTFIGA